MNNTACRIGEVSRLTGVKAGTIRFYEKCGFLSPVERRPNGYRAFRAHHLFQIRVCRLVFGGFVNKRLRKISMNVIAAAKIRDPSAYDNAARAYLQAVDGDIARTKKAIRIVTEHMGQGAQRAEEYSKKQAAELLGTTPEAIRNWERNGLLPPKPPYSKRFYGAAELNRMYVIRLLLDTGYSGMAILRFLTEYDRGRETAAANLLLTGNGEELKYRADRYLETLSEAREQAEALCAMSDEMKKL